MNKASLSEMTTGLETDAEAVPVEPTPDRLIRLPEVMARVGLRRTAIYQRMREGRFPKSRSLGPRCTVWVEAEIDDWIGSIVERTDEICQNTPRISR